MATEYSRAGLARRTNLAARMARPGPQTRDLFDRPEAAVIDDGSSDSIRGEAGQGNLTPHPSFAAKAEIWRDFREGRISMAEAQRRSAKIGVATDPRETEARRMYSAPGKPRPPVARPRQDRPEPNDSRQYANPMATTAARDDRLTPQAKALLQVIRARAGKGRQTAVTKGTLAAILSRSTRSITRYLRDLERCGYIVTKIRASGRGLHLGLVLTLSEKVLPYFTETKRLARWLGETAGLKALVPFMPFSTKTAGGKMASRPGLDAPDDQSSGKQGMTLLSLKNQTRKDSSYRNSNSSRKNKRAASSQSD
ncbi:helix-turn-helix domain-containing protein [Aurantimonas sp. 22II-16-19i]|nr:helix-turn-helix domain-containing protein [Aurantimonas sp. 22II-16-19i]ORE97089.1 hypothetical protein ATO4_11339 [Aurantimonas sp. 22II-16-19i]